ncbi:hypothetical protein KCU65_g1811, partial [Aureobasidium melanogenum]
MEYQQACVTTGASQHPVYAHHNQGYTHPQPVWSAVPQYAYAYEQHPLAPTVGDTFTQTPMMTSGHTTPAEPIVVDGHNGYAPIPPGHPAIYRNGIEVDYGQPVPPTVEFNVDELLEYQRRRSSATSEEKEPLTPAQPNERFEIANASEYKN